MGLTGSFSIDKKTLKKVAIVLITIIFVGLLLTQVSVQDILSTLFMVSPAYLALGFILYASSNMLKAVRFAYVLRSGETLRMFNIVTIHNMANLLMPFRTGELAFIYLVRERINTPVSIGTVTITLSRLLDSLAICLLFMLSLALSPEVSDKLSSFSSISFLMAAALFVIIIVVIFSGKTIFNFLKRFVKKTLLEEVSGYMATMGARRMAIFMLLSLLIWVVNVSGMCLIVMGMGMGLSPITLISGLLLSIVASSLPIHGIGNFGTGELLWSSIFILLGAPAEVAISSAFAAHILSILFSTVLRVYALITDRFIFNAEIKREKAG